MAFVRASVVIPSKLASRALPFFFGWWRGDVVCRVSPIDSERFVSLLAISISHEMKARHKNDFDFVLTQVPLGRSSIVKSVSDIWETLTSGKTFAPP
jgi:hypothetical protein